MVGCLLFDCSFLLLLLMFLVMVVVVVGLLIGGVFCFVWGGGVCFFAVCSSSVGLTGLLVGCSLGLFLGKGRGGVVFCSVNWEEVGSRGGEEELKV